MLNLENVKFKYDKKWVLNGLELSLDLPTLTGLIGANGSGKSTLMRCIAGLHDLNEGNIRWNDKRVFGPSETHLPGSNRIKLVTQDAKVSNYTKVIDNLASRFNQKTKEYIEERSNILLELVELSPHKNDFPENLSGGQKQKLALACALTEMPELLLLDEPFSQIDSASTYRILSRLVDLCVETDTKMILVSHDSDFILSHAELAYVMKNGQFVQNGLPTDIYYKPVNEETAGLMGLYSLIDGNVVRPHNILLMESGSYAAEVISAYPHQYGYMLSLQYQKSVLYALSNESYNRGTSIKFDIKD